MNYAIQNATSNDVLNIELARAKSDMSPATRAAVTTVTLTIGANDINFAECLQQEFQATPDACLRPGSTINNLQPSQQLQSGLDQLTGNLSQSIIALDRAFPNASLYVTTYYQPLPGSVPSGGDACGVYTLPALAALSNNIQGVPWYSVAVAALQYLHVLPDTAKLFQEHFARVSTFLQGRLNAAIRGTLVQASAPVATVALDGAFQGHDICSPSPWVFSLRSTATLAGANVPNNGAVCPYPMPPPNSTEVNQDYPIGPLGSVSILSNCIPHPTPAGQRQIAAAISSMPQVKLRPGAIPINPKTGTGTVVATCTAPAGHACVFTGVMQTGSSRASATAHRPRSRHLAAAIKLGSVMGTIRAGKAGTVKIKLNRSGRSRLSHLKTLKAQVVGSVSIGRSRRKQRFHQDVTLKETQPPTRRR